MVRTPLDRFPVFIRAGSILPTAKGVRCAADVPLLPGEIHVFGGEDGEFLYYNDSGDGYEEGVLIRMRYRNADASLVLEEAAGIPSGTESLKICFHFPDGREQDTTVSYNGGRTCAEAGK